MLTVYDYIYYWDMLQKNSKDVGKCRVWTKSCHDNGYGDCDYLGATGPHQVSWMLANEEDIPEGYMILHTCGGPRSCINDKHLKVGTALENMMDKHRDGTMPLGEKHGGHVLDRNEVREIIESLGNGETIKERADKYDVSKTTISRIDHGKNWISEMTDDEKKIRQDNKDVRSGKKRKLNGIIAKEIRILEKEEKLTVTELAEKFDITPLSIRNVLENKIYVAKDERKELMKKFENARKRIKDNVNKIIDDNGEIHWVWNKSYNGKYGNSSWKSKSCGAHIVSYIAFNEIEETNWESIRHRCNYKGCVYPPHLIPGTIKENNQDKITDGTMPRGETHPSHTISENLARKIKLSKGNGTQLERSIRFGVGVHLLKAIDIGKNWAHLKC
jgi:uncharacterized protein (DUF433 family)